MVAIEKFFMIPRTHEVYKDYVQSQTNTEKVVALFKEFAKQHNIETDAFYSCVSRLHIEPTQADAERFKTEFMVGTPGQFKKTSAISKAWVNLCKENELTKDRDLIDPYLPFVFPSKQMYPERHCRWAFLMQDDNLYCRFSSNVEFTAPSDFKEILGSEFYKIVESVQAAAKE